MTRIVPMEKTVATASCWSASVRLKLPEAVSRTVHPTVRSRVAELLEDRGPVLDIGPDFLGFVFGLRSTEESAAHDEARPYIDKVLGLLGTTPDEIIWVRIVNTSLARRALADDGDDLVGVAEVAEILGVSKQRIYQLAQRDDFPDPVRRLRATPIWSDAEMRDFAKRRRVGH